MEREHEVDEADKGEKQKSEGGENSTPAEKKPVATKSLKVEVRLQAAGDAPIMKQKNYKVRQILIHTEHIPILQNM